MKTTHEMHPDTILEVRGLKKYFPIYSKGFLKKVVNTVKASNDLSFDLKAGTTLGLVGESGCGKTTTARTLLRALAPTDGHIYFRSKQMGVIDLATCTEKELKPLRKEMQMIFQDPFGSLNPRMTVGDIITEPMTIQKIGTRAERTEKAVSIMKKVGLNAKHLQRYPHSFSGGQRQRIGIARALMLEPSLIVCDESVSALDVSVQAQVINLLKDLQREFKLTYIFVAHDLSVVKHICDEVAVMYAGSIVEKGKTENLFRDPLHPYTQGLFSAIPHLDPDVKAQSELKGEVLDIGKLPPGCPFYDRCKLATKECYHILPALEAHGENREVACLNLDD